MYLACCHIMGLILVEQVFISIEYSYLFFIKLRDSNYSNVWVLYIFREATSDRISLGITTCLTMTFLGLEVRTDLPQVSYPTAIDYYVFFSFMFIFFAVVQVYQYPVSQYILFVQNFVNINEINTSHILLRF